MKANAKITLLNERNSASGLLRRMQTVLADESKEEGHIWCDKQNLQAKLR